MSSRDLKLKKSRITIFLLIIVYSLLICQEAVLNRVLCVKSAGEVELECTFLNYQCPCQGNRSSTSDSEDLYSINVSESCSLHIPLSDSYLARILPSGQKIFKKFYDTEIYINAKLDFEDYICHIHHLLPYIRYLQIFPELNQYFILLC